MLKYAKMMERLLIQRCNLFACVYLSKEKEIVFGADLPILRLLEVGAGGHRIRTDPTLLLRGDDKGVR